MLGGEYLYTLVFKFPGRYRKSRIFPLRVEVQ